MLSTPRTSGSDVSLARPRRDGMDAVPPVPDFRALFDAAPAAHLVVDAQLEIVAASDAYLRATGMSRDIVGRHVLEVFAIGPGDAAATGVRALVASLERVRREKRPDTMPLQRHDGGAPGTVGGIAQPGSWRPVNTPLLDARGEVAYVIHSLEPVGDSAAVDGAGRAKDDFLAMLGHELRNPLAAIASATAILKRTGGGSEAAAQSRAVIDRQVRHLKRLV